MTKITEELAATARWVGADSTSKRCKNNENSVLFTYTDKGNMIIAGMVGKGDVEPLTKHIIKTLMEPLDKKSKKFPRIDKTFCLQSGEQGIYCIWKLSNIPPAWAAR